MNSSSACPPDALSALHTAFAADDAAAVREALQRFPDAKRLINEPIGPFDSPAIISVKSKAMLDTLLDAGADINARSRWWAGGFGILDSAPPDLAEYAMTRGARLDAHSAARLGKIEALRTLIEADPALVHARGGDGQTPLHFASTVEIAELLLDHGAAIDMRDIDHESTPAQWMSGERQDVALALVARGCRTDILLATALGDIDLVRRHLHADPACVRMRVSDEYFPMINPKSGGTIYQWTLGWYVSAHQVARKFGRDEILQLLLDRSPPAIKLIDACWTGDAAAVRQVLSANPNMAADLTTADKRHPAHAARNNETAAVRLFLESGFPVDVTGQHQGTPLHWAAFHGNREMAELILTRSPPLEVKDADFHSTPIGWAIHGSQNGWYAKTGDYAGTVEALLRAGAHPPATIGGSAAVQEVLRRAPGNPPPGAPDTGASV